MASTFLTQLRVFRKRGALEESCRWSREKLHAEQAQRTSELRRFATADSPFYARFHRGLENRPLEELPILTKSIMMESFDDLLTDRTLRLKDLDRFLRSEDVNGLFRGQYVVLSTSGSTGQRGIFVYSPAEWVECVASISRPLLWAGVRPHLLRPIRLAIGASTTPWHYSARAGRALSNRLAPTLRFDAAEPVENIVRRLNEWQPAVLTGFPSVLRQLAHEQLVGKLRIAPRYCLAAAEVLTAETRRRVNEAWGLRMFDVYGATEYTPIATECAEGNLHLLEDGAVIEVTDERGKPVPPGALGDRILLTVFRRHTQPLIRYEISDMVRFKEGECRCGRPFRMIAEIEGRQEDVLYFPSHDSRSRDVAVHPNIFHVFFDDIPVAGWQVVQEDGRLTINLAGLSDPAVCDQVSASMRELLAAQGVAVPPIRVLPVSDLRRGKTGKAPFVMAASAR